MLYRVWYTIIYEWAPHSLYTKESPYAIKYERVLHSLYTYIEGKYAFLSWYYTLCSIWALLSHLYRQCCSHQHLAVNYNLYAL